MLGIKTVDHENHVFASVSAMCRYWNVNQRTFRNRIERGWSLAKALTTKPGDNKDNTTAKPGDNKNHTDIQITDHEGTVFESIAAMCDHWHISLALYNRRTQEHWSLEKTLTTPAQNNGFHTVTDSQGKIFPTVRAYCKYHNISTWAYYRQQKTKSQPKRREVVYDHENHGFVSASAMCRYWGISTNTFNKRMKLGWPLEKALTTGPHIYRDHIGQIFHSREDLCRHWNLSTTTYLEQSLQGLRTQDITLQSTGQTTQVYDHKGIEYASPKDMCQQYGISVSSYISRINLHWSIKAALTTPAVTKRYAISYHISGITVQDYLFDRSDGFYYVCTDSFGQKDIYTHQDLQKLEQQVCQLTQ